MDSSHNSLFTNRPLDTPLHPFLEPLKKNVATIKRNATTAGSFRRGKASGGCLSGSEGRRGEVGEVGRRGRLATAAAGNERGCP